MPQKKFKIINRPISSETVSPKIILTRYLYIKEEVLASLAVTILEKRRDEALFWGYELYYSGFEREVIEFVGAMYRDMFQLKNPRLESFMKSQTEAWTKNRSDAILGTLIVNLLSREFEVDWFILNAKPELAENPIKDRKFYMALSESDVEKYKCIMLPEGVSPRFTLPEACVYSTLKNINNVFNTTHKNLGKDVIHNIHCYNWIYYASFSPIWSARINEFGGSVNHEKKTVDFPDDDKNDEFYDVYGYEPDELPREIQYRFTHLIDYEQMSKRAFCERFGAKENTLNVISNQSSECHENSTP